MPSVKAVFKSGPGGGGKNPYEKYLVSHLMGDIIFSEGDIGTDMYIIQAGGTVIVSAEAITGLDKLYGDFVAQAEKALGGRLGGLPLGLGEEKKA